MRRVVVYNHAHIIQRGFMDTIIGWFTTYQGFSTLVSAICTLAVFSLLYRENPISRFFEHIMVGLGLGYGIAITWTDIIKPNWWDRMVGVEGAPQNWWWLLALIPGAMWYFELSHRYVWVSRLIISFFLGVGSGNAFKGTFNLLLADDGQIPESFKPLFGPSDGAYHPDNLLSYLTGGWLYISAGHVNNLIFTVVTLCTLSYFFFSFRPQNNPLVRGTSKMGRWFLMIAFGAIFGTTVQGRMSLLIDRLAFLFVDWLHWAKF